VEKIEQEKKEREEQQRLDAQRKKEEIERMAEEAERRRDEPVQEAEIVSIYITDCLCLRWYECKFCT